MTRENKQKLIKDCQPPTDDWEQYADRLHDIAYKYGYEQAKKDMACTDAVSRQAAIDALKRAYWDKNIQSAKNDPCIVDAMTDWAIRQVMTLPSVSPARPKGKWIKQRCDGKIGIVCSICHSRSLLPYNFCPNCGCYNGADMRQAESEEKE